MADSSKPKKNGEKPVSTPQPASVMGQEDPASSSENPGMSQEKQVSTPGAEQIFSTESPVAIRGSDPQDLVGQLPSAQNTVGTPGKKSVAKNEKKK
ncbi:hypothetical protein OWV82_022508 [Melia azedarach]|uniref:Uncharacterized protein n=1 Tax=Melia azedarach TaxID=155640 RepID=A0ACC1WVK7_MELAZ|nr:hypothetical protein OWV82_022508 [Melia azedarach]